jgi:charged multivesicular body protein 1
MSLENQMFQLKFTSKQFQRMATKCEKNEKAQKLKLKQAIEKGNMEGAKIHAQNAIREKNQGLNYLRLASRIDAVASRVEAAVRMKTVTKTMAGVVKGMEKALESMDIQQITKVMDQFEKQFEDLDVQTEYIEGAMQQSTAATTPVDQVDALIQQVAEEHGLEIQEKLGPTPTSNLSTAHAEQDELSERLAKLKAKT